MSLGDDVFLDEYYHVLLLVGYSYPQSCRDSCKLFFLVAAFCVGFGAHCGFSLNPITLQAVLHILLLRF